ncbi:RNA polymerase sigma factor [Carbonactinospora thermoautotrophica]|uniref:RNA polymerase sigma factor n=1 Tax=Carbonactinospora thermoautotrophica TaxID=1469144 RepID=A0A132MY89_9ACTN|nr:RNA polymerase sigma factor [Carbonactinospora thermoautotrophica]
MLRDERERLLWKTLQELPDKYRLVLTCRYLLELSEAETAQVLGWRHGSVKSRTSRALAKLRALLIPVETGEVTIHT